MIQRGCNVLKRLTRPFPFRQPVDILEGDEAVKPAVKGGKEGFLLFGRRPSRRKKRFIVFERPYQKNT